jgi:hypothetical protein
MPATAKGFPYPAASAGNNVPADLQAICDMLELWPGIPSLTQTQINALSSGAKTPNLHVFNSTTGRVQRWNGAAWVNLVEEGTAATGLVQLVPANVQASGYTLALADMGSLVEMSGGGTLTIPTNAAVAFPVGCQIPIMQTGASQVTIAGSGGVTVNGTPGLKLRTQWAMAVLRKRATDTWVAIGDLTA